MAAGRRQEDLMPYIPNTDADRRKMLETVGVKTVEELFSVIPDGLRLKQELDIPPGLPETELWLYFKQMAAENKVFCGSRTFAGGGVYSHFVPSVVKELAHRNEMYTAYTPYQPEVSQGMLQAIFEYQSFVCLLTGMEASNASSYDGGTAMADATLMARNITKRYRTLFPRFIHPQYREVVATYSLGLGIEDAQLPVREDGALDRSALTAELAKGDVAALVLQVPNYLGFYQEDIPSLMQEAHDAGALVIMAIYPFVAGVMKTPGELGADIAVFEGQALGLPASYGGPLLGGLATTMKHIRQLPGRIVGKTGAAFGREGFVMTLQAREQHIRREKAASNICTNEALAAYQATVYLASIGKDGFHRIARKCEDNAHYAAEKLDEVKGLKRAFPQRAFFNEFAVMLEEPAKLEPVRRKLLGKGWLPGIPLEDKFPELPGGLLLAFTEMHTRETIDAFVGDLKEALNG
jgi:glycine dehydrogenase subunit 1